MKSLLNYGASVILVSHSAPAILSFCKKSLLFNYGKKFRMDYSTDVNVRNPLIWGALFKNNVLVSVIGGYFTKNIFDSIKALPQKGMFKFIIKAQSLAPGSYEFRLGLRETTLYLQSVCFDDPEASEYLSRYLAPGFDFAFVGNAGCLDMYRSWGIQNVDFLPLGVSDTNRDLTLTEEDILTGRRDVPIVFLAGRDKHRDLWMAPLIKEFSEAVVYGNGWPNGYLPQNQQITLCRNSRIGWNMDQSVGPVTSRTYMLPANGALSIGNNRTRLGKLFELGVEAIGFDTLQECIEYTRYYLAHDEERRQIAARGWRRAVTDYTADEAIWDRMLSTIQPFCKLKSSKR